MNRLSELPIGEGLKSTFAGLIKKDRLPHAILLDGGDDVSRNSVSLFLAASFVCESESRPCGICPNCSKTENGIHPDVVVSDPKELNEKTFKIALVRDIKSDAFILPNEAAKKVYILKQADKMNIQAQNALLKILEEPPAYVRFILECDSRAAMLDTIMSRVTAFNLGAGSILLDDAAVQKADALAGRFAEALMNPAELEFMRLTSELEKDKDMLTLIIPSLTLIFRDAAVINAGSDIIIGNHADTSRRLASKFPLKSLTALVGCCEHFNECINKNANKNLLITRFCSVIRQTAYGA